MVAKYTALSNEKPLLGSTLNSLLNNGFSKTTDVSNITISNDQVDERYIFGDFVIKIGTQGGNRNGDAIVALYLIPLYTVGQEIINPVEGLSQLNANYFVGHGSLDASSASRVAVIRGVRLPPSDYFPVVSNKTGQAFASSGNGLSVFSYGYEDVT